MRIGTLFSGIGSPEQGAKRVWGDSFKLVFACEWDKFARQSFKANYEIGDKNFHIDINEMDGTQYKNKVDIIVGGSPCQDFSIAGLRAGIEGKRGQLIWQYFRIIDEVRPQIFVYENVKGMVSDKGGKTLDNFLTVFRSIGYNCHYEVLNTKDYGVPQNRQRVFIVGFLDIDLYYKFQFAPKIPLEKRLRDVLEPSVNEKYYLSDKIIECFDKRVEISKGYEFKTQIGDKVANCLTTRYGNSSTDTYIKEPMPNQVGTLDIKENDSIKRVYSSDGLSPCLTTVGGGNREPKILDLTNSFGEGKTREYTEFSPTLRSERFGLAVQEPTIQVVGTTGGGNEMNSRIYNINGIAPTLNAGNNGGGQSPVKHLTEDCRIRKLTPKECLRLQDFPDEFYVNAKNAGLSDSQLYKQAGNSITVAVIEMIFRQIEKTINDDCCLCQGSLF